MKRFAGVIAAISLAGSIAHAQDPDRIKIYTQPKAPSWHNLRRLDLSKAFHIRLKMNGRRDGISSIQVIPHKDGEQLLVQTHYGRVSLVDGENGDILWTTAVDKPFERGHAPTANSHSVFTTRGDRLYVLNRANGLNRVFTVDPFTKVRKIGFDLPLAPSSSPAAGEQIIYFNMETQIVAYTVPDFGLLDEIKADRQKKGLPVADPKEMATTLQLEFLWGYETITEVLLQTPLLTAGQVAVMGSNGRFLSLNRFEPKLRFTFKATDKVSTRLGQYQDLAYIPTLDDNLYAVNIVNGDLTWRFLSQGRIEHPIIANDNDVYVTPFQRGLIRIDRKSGEVLWRQPRAARFLSAGRKFVFAVNNREQLLIIGHPRGSFLACLDMSKWKVPVTNHWTDRMYFAAHDGQILCLRHRDNRQPVYVKSWSGSPEEKIDLEKLKRKIDPFSVRLQTPALSRWVLVSRPSYDIAKRP